jgi:hypothetical protein
MDYIWLHNLLIGWKVIQKHSKQYIYAVIIRKNCQNMWWAENI